MKIRYQNEIRNANKVKKSNRRLSDSENKKTSKSKVRNMVSKRKKDYEKLKNNPRNVRFKDFKTVVKRFGFNLDRSKGSHEIYKREDVKELINLQPRKRDKSKAKPYQVGQFINIIDEYNLLEED